MLPPRGPSATCSRSAADRAASGRGSRSATDYVGVEPDPDSCAVAGHGSRRAGGRGEVRNGDLSAVRDGEQFDLVCAFEVIEHIEDDEEALAELGLAAAAGRLAAAERLPASSTGSVPADEMVGHFRRYDPTSWRGCCARSVWGG